MMWPLYQELWIGPEILESVNLAENTVPVSDARDSDLSFPSEALSSPFLRPPRAFLRADFVVLDLRPGHENKPPGL